MIGFALSALGLGKRLFNWLRSLPWYVLAIGALALLSAFLWHRGNHIAKQRDRALAGLKIERQAHAADISRWQAAQRQAEAAQQANLTRVAKLQKDISNETITAYRADADNWRARFAKLRASGNRGASGETGLPAISPTPSGTVPAGGDTGRDPETVAVKVDDLETLVENSLLARAIQDWAIRQAAVETSPVQ